MTGVLGNIRQQVYARPINNPIFKHVYIDNTHCSCYAGSLVNGGQRIAAQMTRGVSALTGMPKS